MDPLIAARQPAPEFSLPDLQGRLRYQGAPDDTSFRQRTPTRSYLAQAVAALLQGDEPNPNNTSPYGCAILRMNG